MDAHKGVAPVSQGVFTSPGSTVGGGGDGGGGSRGGGSGGDVDV